ncbi:MAG: cupredoxin domain-containing protein [Solirubrobacteraceae bacterium]
MRKLLIVVLVAAASAVLASPALAAGRSVKVGDDYYVRKGDPPTVTVEKGTRVTWNFTGRDKHNVAVTRGPARFNSSFKKSGSYSKTITRTGTYTIVCTIHQPDMTMKLKVVR